MSRVLLLDGSPLPDDAAIAGASSPGLRYGEGVFETMKLASGRVALFHYHMDRLWAGLRAFGLDVSWTPALLEREVVDCCTLNGIQDPARVRLMVYRDVEAIRRIIQAWPLDTAEHPGLDIDVFPYGRKAADAYANFKCNNYLLYLLAARWAHAQGLGECLVLNTAGRVADGSIANVFWVKDGRIYTPPLSEGGVAGVMRRHLAATNLTIERPVFPEELLEADEIFFTNAVTGIRWVSRFGHKTYKRFLVLK